MEFDLAVKLVTAVFVTLLFSVPSGLTIVSRNERAAIYALLDVGVFLFIVIPGLFVWHGADYLVSNYVEMQSSSWFLSMTPDRQMDDLHAAQEQFRFWQNITLLLAAVGLIYWIVRLYRSTNYFVKGD